MTTIALEQRTAVGPHRRELQVILARAPVGAAVVIACTIPRPPPGRRRTPTPRPMRPSSSCPGCCSWTMTARWPRSAKAASCTSATARRTHSRQHPTLRRASSCCTPDTTRPDDRRLRGLAPGRRCPQSLTIPPRTRISTQRTIESSTPGTSTNTPVRASAARHDTTFARAQHRRPPDRHVLPSRSAGLRATRRRLSPRCVTSRRTPGGLLPAACSDLTVARPAISGWWSTKSPLK